MNSKGIRWEALLGSSTWQEKFLQEGNGNGTGKILLVRQERRHGMAGKL